MTIEIPDRFLELMKKMPAVSKSGKYKHVKDGDLLAKIIHKKELCVTMVIVCRAIAKRSEEMGWIRFDPDTQTWQGVDYDGD